MLYLFVLSVALFGSVIAPNPPRDNGTCCECSECSVSETACLAAQDEPAAAEANYSDGARFEPRYYEIYLVSLDAPELQLRRVREGELSNLRERSQEVMESFNLAMAVASEGLLPYEWVRSQLFCNERCIYIYATADLSEFLRKILPQIMSQLTSSGQSIGEVMGGTKVLIGMTCHRHLIPLYLTMTLPLSK